MEFLKYQHIERFGNAEVNGIDNGTCYIFPKIDGTNASLWYDLTLKAGSRRRELSLEDDNAGFLNWAIKQPNIELFFREYPELRIYGEWLIPHTLRTYQENAWRKFYVFDVMDGKEYIAYEEYIVMLEQFDIDYIPAICKVNNPTYERLIGQLDKNIFLIQDGEGTGEGIVIKNYDFKNKYGRTVWAKIIKNEFKTKHSKKELAELKEKSMVEEAIAKEYVTTSLIEKEFAKINNDTGWSSKQIPRLLNTVFYTLIKEESWEFIKKHKNPVIDYKRLNYFTINRIKEEKPELFS